MFTYYTYPLGRIIQSHNLKYHIYADDTQIYIEFDPKIPGDTVIALHKLQECIRELRSWMTVNKLKLNEEKTEFFIAASTHNMNYLNNVSLDVCGTQIKPSNFVRNLGVYFDGNMTMSNHVSSLTRSLNFNLRNIGRIRRYIDEDTCNHTVRSLVLSRLDYSISLLYGITSKDMKKLQTIQNRSARLIFKANRREHTSPLLQQCIGFQSLNALFSRFFFSYLKYVWERLLDIYQTYSVIMFIQTILDSLDHMLTNTSLHTRELLLHMVIKPLLTLCPNYGINYP